MTVPDVVLPLALLAAAIAAWAGGSGRLRRNHLVGIRIPSTFASDAAWRAGHRASVVPAATGFVVTAVAGALTIGLSGRSVVGTWVVVLVFAAAVVWMLVRASRAARSAG